MQWFDCLDTSVKLSGQSCVVQYPMNFMAKKNMLHKMLKNLWAAGPLDLLFWTRANFRWMFLGPKKCEDGIDVW